MNLIERMKEHYIFMNEQERPDGQGGFYQTWVEGARFDAAITTDRRSQRRTAEKEEGFSVYTVTVNQDISLPFHAVFKREGDGKAYRVTSNGADQTTPVSSGFSFRQVTAEDFIIV